jgi:hypothetical protein
VRGLALLALARYYSRSGNLRIGDLLARIVYDEKEDLQVRSCGYTGLLSLPEDDSRCRWTSLDFRFPDDVDWTFVDSFRRQRMLTRFTRRVGRIIGRLLRTGRRKTTLEVEQEHS